MKKVRKLISLALAMVMALAMCVTAYADEPAGTNTGTITVDNASKGETYTLVKLFDATYNEINDAIVYKLVEGEDDVPQALTNYFVKNVQGRVNYVEAKAAAKAADGTLSTEAVTAITTWAKTVTSGAHYVDKKTAAGGTLTFTDLAHGYYVVVSRSSSTPGGVVSVTSLGPNQNIQDKSTSDNPHFPEDGTGKKINGNKFDTVAVGDTVTYTVTYHTVNWINKDGIATNGAETKVTKYVVKDTLPAFLSDVTVTSVTVTEGTAAPKPIMRTISNIGDFRTEKKSFEIPWVNSDGESLYANGAVLTITYTATVTKDILTDDTAAVNHTNEITITPNDEEPGNDDKTTADVYTGKIKVQKYAADKDNATLADKMKPLAGAKFILADKESMEATGVKYAKIDDSTGKVTWVDDKTQATTRTTDAKGEIMFEGLDDGTYYLEETEAPAGYNKLNARKAVTISSATTENKTNITQPAEVVNKTGAQLPSTGGIGTTIFYVVGSILMLAAVVLFVTKKRSAER